MNYIEYIEHIGDKLLSILQSVGSHLCCVDTLGAGYGQRHDNLEGSLGAFFVGLMEEIDVGHISMLITHHLSVFAEYLARSVTDALRHNHFVDVHNLQCI